MSLAGEQAIDERFAFAAKSDFGGGGAHAVDGISRDHRLEVIKAVARVNGAALPVTYGPRRAGDPAAIVAGAARVREVLGWQPQYENLDFIVETALNWERKLEQRNTTG